MQCENVQDTKIQYIDGTGVVGRDTGNDTSFGGHIVGWDPAPGTDNASVFHASDHETPCNASAWRLPITTAGGVSRVGLEAADYHGRGIRGCRLPRRGDQRLSITTAGGAIVLIAHVEYTLMNSYACTHPRNGAPLAV